jgi:hypothetical protein
VPRLAHRALTLASERRDDPPYEKLLRQMIREQRRTRRTLWLGVVVVLVALGLLWWRLLKTFS